MRPTKLNIPRCLSSMRIYRSCFTLMEMLVVMTLIVIVAGAIGMNVAGALRETRFRSGTELVLDKLQMAQDLMLIMDQDIRIKFDKVDGQLRCLFEVDAKLTPALRVIMNKNTDIAGIQNWEFVEADSHRKLEGKFNLEFGGGGTKMSRGVLHLQGADREEIIPLPGYPSPLGKGTVQYFNNNENSYEALYPKEIRKIIEDSQAGKRQAVSPS